MGRSSFARRHTVCVGGVLLLVTAVGPAGAAFEYTWPDARSAGMLAPGSPFGVASVEWLRGTADSTCTRPRDKNLRVTVSAGELYGVPEASGWSAHARADVGVTTLTAAFSRLGGELYEERTALLEVAHQVGSDLAVSTRLRGLGIAARGLDDRWTGSLDAAVTTRLVGRVLVGAAGENITRSMIGDSPVAARAAFGAALVLPGAFLRCSLVLVETFAPSTAVGVEVALTDRVRVRAGAADVPRRLGFGVGLGREGGSWPVLDLAGQWHPELGVSTFVSITFAT
jgi:hypothetical protein